MPCFLSISLASETCPRRRAGGACDEPTDRRGGQVGADFSYDLAVPAESRPPWLATADMRQERVSVCTLSSSSERQKCHPSAKRKVSPIRPGRTSSATTGPAAQSPHNRFRAYAPQAQFSPCRRATQHQDEQRQTHKRQLTRLRHVKKCSEA